jgi:hypothetical protein
LGPKSIEVVVKKSWEMKMKNPQEKQQPIGTRKAAANRKPEKQQPKGNKERCCCAEFS